MNLIKPKKIKPGDTIGIIAPCGEVEKELILNSVKYFEKKGYNVKLGKNIFRQNDYLAGTDKERISDLEEAFLDTNIDAIVCARGGYGAIRIINDINYEIIKQNPKIFCGYSDITALSAMIYKKTGLITFSGAMAQSDFSNDEIDSVTQNSFWNTLEKNEFDFVPQKVKVYNKGKISGKLLVGNLATFASLAGIDFVPDEKFIFMIEDVNEPVYKIDRYIHQLLNIPKFKQNLSGILLGDFLGIDNDDWFEALWQEIGCKLNIPVAGGFRISHGKEKITIPYGINFELELKCENVVN